MNNEYIKLASYYVIFNDNTGGCSVRFYDRDGNQLKLLYFSWDKRQEEEKFNELLENKLDHYHKWKMRPKIIKIYESNIGKTIGYYDKNDNLIYSAKYDCDTDTTLDSILMSNLDDVPIDIEYLKQTKNVTVVNEYNLFFNKYSKIACKYWNSFIKRIY